MKNKEESVAPNPCKFLYNCRLVRSSVKQHLQLPNKIESSQEAFLTFVLQPDCLVAFFVVEYHL